MSAPLILGAVAYDPKVVTIWDGFRAWLRSRGFEFDFVLYSHYERQVEALMEGSIDVAWNSPLAWLRCERLAASMGVNVRTVAMRDTDRDLTSVVVVRADSGIETTADLKGRVVGVGAIDSPQATLLPISLLRSHGLDSRTDFTLRGHEIGVGLHGDHIGGERDAARALRDRAVDAACMVDANLLTFGREGTLPSDSVRVLAQTDPYDHCNMTAGPRADSGHVDEFTDLLLDMSYADAEVRLLLDLEGLKEWLPGRSIGYGALDKAVDETALYDRRGAINASNYRP
jgi:phosphonate transport system substrate-binding protein